MNKKSKTKKRDKLPPITDGDTRPDITLDVSDKKKLNKEKKKFTKERGADVNSMEDYKDAK